MKTSILLSGLWDWHIPGGQNQKITVPSCYHCVGDAYYEKDFEILNLPTHQKVVLRFEGIHYEGHVWVNSVDIGEMFPYCRYEFDITDYIKTGTNHITVLVQDITAEFGPTSGWEDYGGISRDVFLYCYDDAYVLETQWITHFNGDYTAADCELKVWIENPFTPCNADVCYEIIYNNSVYLSGNTGIDIKEGRNEIPFRFHAVAPPLWSPELPNICELKIRVMKNNAIVDRKTETIGFREFKAVGTRFYLNGKDTVLKGICRHEMWGEHQGFTLSKEQIERDFRLIKQLGANYVRLVHYPHNEYTLEVADRMGIMVSEEPGLWWSDFRSGRMEEKALEILSRTVHRDRNRACLIFWLLFNECRFAGDYPSRGKKVCRDLDPTRLVSAANCMDIDDTKNYFDEQGLDFYTYHAYGYRPKYIGGDRPLSVEDACRCFKDKPLVFTEWGGWFIHNNVNLINGFKRDFVKFMHNRSPEPNLAGIAWWQFQDIYQFYRGLPGVVDGQLSDGLVDNERNIKPMYNQMSDLFRLIDEPAPPVALMSSSAPAQLICNCKIIEPNFPFDNRNMKALSLVNLLQSSEQQFAWEQVLKNTARRSRAGHHSYVKSIGPVIPQKIESIGRIPVCLEKGQPLVFSRDYECAEVIVNEMVSEVFFFGHVTYCEGYPALGKYGDPVMNYEFVYEDGGTDLFELKNGIDFSSASMLCDGSRMNPISVNAFRVIELTYEQDWEHYQICWQTCSINPTKKLNRIKMQLVGPGETLFTPLVYGITVKTTFK
ncbi:glycoside hydrolase family 2 protein [Paenibacillus cremeus]|uniref:Beta-galactosidase n=1 Tax=Paenibacillus cremeus TaxID=2163881 RepID=A0A559K0V7_9BACL|nr:glycoside hydrolase family 2 TIM barrel-domain containing protein [Paenibacillus cremeus]TVY05680.1 hypothetical protein FPZ49_28825 [Paenibacillus cremeus]